MIIEEGTDAAVVGAFHPPLGENTFQNTTICILLEIQQGSASSKEWCCSISETSSESLRRFTTDKTGQHGSFIILSQSIHVKPFDVIVVVV